MVCSDIQWNNCWREDDKIGAGLAMAEFHGCHLYTHTKGERNRYLEFTSPIINDLKPVGILTHGWMLMENQSFEFTGLALAEDKEMQRHLQHLCKR